MFRRSLSIVCAVLALLTFVKPPSAVAEKINTAFIKIDYTKKYRMVSQNSSGGSVCVGARHDSECIVYCLPDSSQLSEDCYWYVENHDGRWAFRNAATGGYLTYTPAKDYVTYDGLYLTPEAEEESHWTVGIYNGHLTFSYEESSVDYFINVDSAMVGSSKYGRHSVNSQFVLYDADGEAVDIPVYTHLALYADSLCFDGKRVPYDGNRFLYPLPSDWTQAADYRPEVSFVAADGAAYAWQVQDAEGNVADGMVFSSKNIAEPFTLTLLRDGEAVCSDTLVLTNHPVVEVNVESISRTVYCRGDVRITDRQRGSTNGVMAADLRQRGKTAAHYPKVALNVKLVTPDGEDLDSAILGIRPENSWILDAMAIDRIRMRNRLLFDLWNRFSTTPYDTDYNRRNGTTGHFVEVILNGEYNGLYCLSDKIDRKLLNLKKARVNADSTEVTVRGLLYKSNSWDNTSLKNSHLDPTARMDSDVWNNWELQVPDEFPSENTWNPLLDLYELCSSEDRFAEEFETSFYRDNVIDFYLFVLAFNMTDNGNKNLFLSTPNIRKEARFLFTPWDLDATIGGYYDGRYYGGTYDELAVADARINFNNPFYAAWRSDINNFRADMAARWFELRNSHLSPDSVNALFEHYAAQHVAFGAWEREVAAWTVGTPIVEDLNEEIGYLEDWYLRRCAVMDEYFSVYTGISDVSADTLSSAPRGIYTLSGVKVSDSAEGVDALPSGVYVVDGRKVLR